MVRDDVDHGRVRSPNALVVEEEVFGLASDVDDTEVGIDVGPGVGRGLALVIESCWIYVDETPIRA